MSSSTEEPFIIKPGPSAFSAFRQAQLARSLGAADARAIWVHFVNPRRPLAEGEERALDQ
ncbi:MAG: hypothetical protein INR71_16455, partial [Terriglobus roseus]|nr:hypothetical protein [Terriglobus roseus]